MGNQPIVILGTGLAGYSVAREFRKLEPQSPLTILTADDGRYYSKPVLSGAFTNGKTPETIAIADMPTMAKQLSADIRVFTQVTAIHPGAKTIHIDEETLQYGKLVLAIGADPIHIPVTGNAQDRVMSVNDLRDYTRFRQAIAGAKHLVIMGAGLIGCEFANDLHHGGIRVDVVDPAPYPLNRFLPEPVGRAIERELSSRIGVHWRFGQTIVSVDSDKNGLAVTFSNGEVVQTDGVLSSVGLRPRTQLASAAGIRINRGIVTDRFLETSAPDVFALGDCAEVEGLVLPFVMPIMHAARALAKTLAGERTPVSYPAMPILVKTTAYPVIISPPRMGIPGAWEIDEREGGVQALYYGEDKTLQGFALTGTAVAEKNKLTKELPPVLG
jgi:rubredoxin-NAD+ reductase